LQSPVEPAGAPAGACARQIWAAKIQLRIAVLRNILILSSLRSHHKTGQFFGFGIIGASDACTHAAAVSRENSGPVGSIIPGCDATRRSTCESQPQHRQTVSRVTEIVAPPLHASKITPFASPRLTTATRLVYIGIAVFFRSRRNSYDRHTPYIS
jgi:hypothetical protein